MNFRCKILDFTFSQIRLIKDSQILALNVEFSLTELQENTTKISIVLFMTTRQLSTVAHQFDRLCLG